MKKKRFVVGLTGGIATGKTEVLNRFAALGIPTISSDRLAHDCLRKGGDVYRAVVRHFGKDILKANRDINRRALGALVFSHPRERRWLERQVHPCVKTKLRAFIQSHQGLMVIDIPLLFEARMESWVDHIIVVSSRHELQVKRLLRRNQLSRSAARARMQAQLPLAEKRRRAHAVIHNNRSLASLREQAKKWARHLQRLAQTS